jgi:hypothetical protein
LRLPRALLLPLSAALTASAYYLILFTDWGNPYHGGSYRGAVATDAVAVLAAFACVEVMRTDRAVPVRALAGALGAPLVLVLALMLWYGLRRYLAV